MASERILATGKIVGGEIIMTKHAYTEYLCSLTEDEEPPRYAPVDGELQRLIDEAEMTEDYEWDIDDRNIWRRGGW